MFRSGEDPFKTALEPLLTLWSPTAKIKIASFPNIDLRPPGNISSLRAVPCVGISEALRVKEPERTCENIISPNEEEPLPLINVMVPLREVRHSDSRGLSREDSTVEDQVDIEPEHLNS